MEQRLQHSTSVKTTSKISFMLGQLGFGVLPPALILLGLCFFLIPSKAIAKTWRIELPIHHGQQQMREAFVGKEQPVKRSDSRKPLLRYAAAEAPVPLSTYVFHAGLIALLVATLFSIIGMLKNSRSPWRYKETNEGQTPRSSFRLIRHHKD